MLTITFSEEQHKYACIELPEVNFTSVSTLINMYHEKFDSDTHAKRIAEREGVSKEEILAKWAAENLKAVTRGTKYHLQQEEKLYKNPKTKRHDTHNGFKKAFDIYSLEPGIYPELIVYEIEHEIIGTADYVEIFSDNTFIVRDFKTNKELKLKGYMEFNSVTKTKSEKKMFAPLSHLGDCNFNHYSIQLSTYAYLLEQVGYRLRPNGLTINHILFDNEDNPVDVVDYPVPYLKKEVKALLTHFKKNKDKLKTKPNPKPKK